MRPPIEFNQESRRKLPRKNAGNIERAACRGREQHAAGRVYWVGQNIEFEFRSADEKADRLPGLAEELVRLKVDVIVALYVPSALAAKHATRDIPIVIIAADPVETGIVSSLARPRANITGVSLMSAASNAKNIELFREMLPSARRVAMLGNSLDPIFAKAIFDRNSTRRRRRQRPKYTLP